MNPAPFISLNNPSSFYFGKITSRGDFVKSGTGTKVIDLFDRWIAQGMEKLLENPGWKQSYDNAGAIDFLFLGTRKRHAISGSLIPSSDASNRRFPFIAATLFEIDHPLAFLPFSPLILERHLNHQRALIHHAAKAHDASDALATLDDNSFEVELAREKLEENYRHFLLNTSIAGLGNALAIHDIDTTIRQILLGVGYLLRPLLTNPALLPQKAIAFPLPRDPARLALVKALWLDLTSIFLARVDFELSIFCCNHFGRPKLIVGFNGTTASTFQALFDEPVALEYLIDVSHSTWVDECIGLDPSVLKLSSYLEHGELSLEKMTSTFHQCFSG